MSEYVWSTHDLLLGDGRFSCRLNLGQAWWADDPLVLARPEFFSATPLSIASTTGRAEPGITPVVRAEPPRASVPVVDDAERAVAAINAAAEAPALAETNPVVESVVQADVVRRGPGRPRKDGSRG